MNNEPMDQMAAVVDRAQNTDIDANRTKLQIIILCLIVTLETIAIMTFLLMLCFKGIKITSTMSGKRVAEIYNVCDGKIIDRWNKIFNTRPHKEDGPHDVVAEVKKLASDIVRLPNYDKDITCQYFLYQNATYESSRDDINSTVDAMHRLNKKGLNISDHVLYRQSIDDIDRFVKLFNDSRNKTSNKK